MKARLQLRRVLAAVVASGLAATLASACAGGGTGGAATVRPGTVAVLGAENEYGDVLAQVGGRYVTADAVMSDPNTDPHTFEASAATARLVAGADLVVQNGVGYDTFMNRLEAATPNSRRKVIDVQTLLGLPDDTANPHLWYQPSTMPAVAAAVARDLSALQPAHAGYFQARARSFDAALRPWYAAIAAFASAHPGVPVATTEPVGDYLLHALGARILTPPGLEADVMNGVDPSPEAVADEERLLADRSVRVFVYNQQVTDALTASFLDDAKSHGIPVVGVYETMPTGFDYQGWMEAETAALTKAVVAGTSTTKL